MLTKMNIRSKKHEIGELVSSDPKDHSEILLFKARQWTGINWVDGYIVTVFGTRFENPIMKLWTRPNCPAHYLFADFIRDFDTAVEEYEALVKNGK